MGATKMDPEIYKLLQRIHQDKVAIVTDGALARKLSQKPDIKRLRSTDRLFIGKDHRKNVTIIYKL